MKKLARIVLAIMLSFPLMFGGIFSILTSEITPVSQVVPQGGGGNPLTSDDDDSYPQENDDKDDENNTESEEITYTYKTYYDYFVDNMDCTGVYDTDGNLTNVTISAEKKAEILSTDFTGSGTSTDPYQVNSSLGFWFMSKFVTLSNKYVELNCDVILNDETFDENGNASGGDGVVYSWEPITGAFGANIYGNNNTIFGLYINDAEKEGCCLFLRVKEISNLSNKNIYINGDGCNGFVRNADKVFNCKNLSGYIYANFAYGIANYVTYIKDCINCININGYNNAAGICHIAETIENCENYGDIKSLKPDDSATHASGILLFSTFLIENCKNFGDISGYEYVGGFLSIGYPENCSVTIKNCENYGGIAGDRYCGGIVGGNYYYEDLRIENCKNYGTIYAKYVTGGIIGYVHKDTTIIDCLVDCQIASNRFSATGLVGRVYSNDTDRKTKLEIINTKVNANSNYIITTISDNSIVNILNLEVKQEFNFDKGCFVNEFYSGSLEIKNVFINIKNSTTNKDYYICKYETNKNCKISIKNLLIETKDAIRNFSVCAEVVENLFVDGIIVVNGKTPYYYYGNDFSGFYISWRTGKFGLKRNDSSFFQSEVTKEKIIAMGATEKTS